MFRASSWIHRGGVALLLVASLGAGSIAAPHADGSDDAACRPTVVAHDARAHYVDVDSRSAPIDAGHCFLCHSLRSFYPAFDKFEHHHQTRRVERLHVVPIDRASADKWALVPGRAPPV
jgi:hypothetical protein